MTDEPAENIRSGEVLIEAVYRAISDEWAKCSFAMPSDASALRFAAAFAVERLRRDGMCDIAIWRRLVKDEHKRVCYCPPHECRAPAVMGKRAPCVGRRASEELAEFAEAMKEAAQAGL